MIAVYIDRRSVEHVPLASQSVGDLLDELARRLRGRVWASVVLNGWQRCEPSDEKARSLPVSVLTRIDVETMGVEEAVGRALAAAAPVALAAADLARRAAQAYRRGTDAEGHDALLRFCSLADDLGALAQAIEPLGEPARAAAPFLASWSGSCRQSLGESLAARESGDFTLLADRLADLASSLEALAGEAGGPG